ncbi:MAG TPA: P-type DNA transfer ATPase VirB11 [Sphingomicrobium sp.]|nr:P-type DNA transfer ATPase VirB11 [Sphingomicrobium sp.]
MSIAAAELVPGGVYLRACLAPFEPIFARSEVTDIYVNRPGELWVETLDGLVERLEDPNLSELTLARLARQIAALTHQGVSREHPLLAATLPDGSRIQLVVPPATRGPLALAIRRHVAPSMSLQDYAERGHFSETLANRAARPKEEELRSLAGKGEFAAALSLAVRFRKNIVVSGGTSSGKTTFLNALLREIPREERLILIEDTPELVVEHDNSIGLVCVRGELGEAKVSANDLVSASLRMRPDRIILGELRGPEAFAFLRAINSGHPGSMTTIHADSPESAVEQLAMLVLQGGTRLGRDDVRHYVRQSIDLFVQLSRTGGRRSVDSVVLRERAGGAVSDRDL